MAKFFSKSSGGFYTDDIHGSFTVSIVDPTWRPSIKDGQPDDSEVAPTIEIANPDCGIPSDAVEISQEQYAAMMEGQRQGGQISADAAGFPALIAAPLATHRELVEVVFSGARALRTKLFGVVDGLQISALVNGNTADAQAIETFKTGLRNITKLDLSGAATDAEMRAVINGQYQALTAAAPVSVRMAFAQAVQ